MEEEMFRVELTPWAPEEGVGLGRVNAEERAHLLHSEQQKVGAFTGNRVRSWEALRPRQRELLTDAARAQASAVAVLDAVRAMAEVEKDPAARRLAQIHCDAIHAVHPDEAPKWDDITSEQQAMLIEAAGLALYHMTLEGHIQPCLL